MIYSTAKQIIAVFTKVDYKTYAFCPLPSAFKSKFLYSMLMKIAINLSILRINTISFKHIKKN